MIDIWNFLVSNWDKVMTIAFAGLSAVFAGLSFLVIWREYKRNNANIIVKMNQGLAGYDPQPFISCNAVNSGRRPITITGFRFLLKDKSSIFFHEALKNGEAFIMPPPKLPLVLEETEKIEVMLHQSALEEAVNNNESRLDSLVFSDSVGNEHKYKISPKKWKNLFKDKK